MLVPLLRLQCGVNSYDWGKKGNDSAAAKFAAATPADGFSIQSDKPYAELWMGTHPSNPSKDLKTGRTLLDLVDDNQALLSETVVERYGKKLPFLFKILSINKALSIQAHPNKKLAEQLHAKDPKNYPDDNHKPEMAIAITDFEGLCGFRPLNQIAKFLDTVPALREFVGEEAASAFTKQVKAHGEDSSDAAVADNKTALRSLFTTLMSRPQSALESATKTLIEAASSASASSSSSSSTEEPFKSGGIPSELITRLHTSFGADYGLFVLFLLNYVTMSPGEALYLRADDIHAYISGDIVECMAASDNVVRAGFTPKYKDVDTLTSMLTYDFAPIEDQKMHPVEYPFATLNRAAYSSGSECILYDPPIDEFSVVRTVLKKGAGGGASGASPKVTLDPLQGPSIVICTQGRGRISVGPTSEDVETGYVFFVGATAEVVLESTVEGEEDEFVTFKAFCEVEDKKNGAS